MMTLTPRSFVHRYTWPEKLLNVALNDFSDVASINQKAWAPAVDIKEEENKYIVTADLPGIQSKDIEITMDNYTLTISGVRKQESEQNEKGYHRVERSYGSFSRSFSFPQNADAEGIKASNKEGVLEITIPKKTSALPKKIQIT